ncbi:transposase [Cupriavidus sp. GA3-3]|nr:transposase [Cupriavidus sp. GA3-3]
MLRARRSSGKPDHCTQDILTAVTDGLKGMEQALNAVFPQTRLQSCIMHLIRNSLGYASRKECRAVAAAIKLLWLALRNRYYGPVRNFVFRA